MDYSVKTTVTLYLSSMEIESLRDELGEIQNILSKNNLEFKETTNKLIDILDNYHEYHVMED